MSSFLWDSVILSVVGVIDRVSVRTGPHLTVPTLNQSLILACQGASPGGLPGPPYLVDKVVWYKDGQKVTLDERMRLMDNNATLRFDSLLPSDGGFYRCQSTMPKYRMERAFSVGYLLSSKVLHVHSLKCCFYTTFCIYTTSFQRGGGNKIEKVVDMHYWCNNMYQMLMHHCFNTLTLTISTLISDTRVYF